MQLFCGLCDGKCSAAGQKALNSAAVEVAEDLRLRTELPQSPQEVQPLLSLLDQLCGLQCPSEVLADVNTQIF